MIVYVSCICKNLTVKKFSQKKKAMFINIFTGNCLKMKLYKLTKLFCD